MKRSEQLPAGYMRYTRFHSFSHMVCDFLEFIFHRNDLPETEMHEVIGLFVVGLPVEALCQF